MFLLPLLLAACTVSGKPSEPDPSSAQVEAAPEVAEPLPSFLGVVTSRKNKVIISEVDAKIESLPISAGKRVKAGELIAKLDDSKLKAELTGAKLQAAAAAGDAGAQAASARAAKDRLSMESKLMARGVAARSTVNEAKWNVAQASAGAGGAGGRYGAAKNSVAQIETLIQKTSVKAPFDGVVTRLKVRDGSQTNQGTAIAYLFDDSDLLIRFKVDHDHRSLVKKGDRIAFKIEGEQRPVLATITEISEELEPPLNFIIVEADLDDTKLAPDQIKVASSGRVSLYDLEQAQAPQKTAAR